MADVGLVKTLKERRGISKRREGNSQQREMFRLSISQAIIFFDVDNSRFFSIIIVTSHTTLTLWQL